MPDLLPVNGVTVDQPFIVLIDTGPLLFSKSGKSFLSEEDTNEEDVLELLKKLFKEAVL